MDLRCERCQGVLTASPAGGVCPHCGHAVAAHEEGEGLDAELGAAFDSMLRPAPEAPEAGEDPTSIEWYVAIEGQQVGPVSFEDLKERWSRGVIGPDSLCWRAGLPDWVPIAGLPELHRNLPPPPPIARKGESTPAVEGRAPSSRSDAQPAKDDTQAKGGAGAGARASARTESRSGTEPEPGWKPSAASALESLVEREMEEAEKRQTQATDPSIPDPETTGIRVILRDLPEPPPPEPSKFIPIPKNVPAPAPEPVARPQRPVVGAPKAEAKSRAGLFAALGILVVAGGAAAAYFGGLVPGLSGGSTEPRAVAAAPEPPPAPPPAPAEPAKEEPPATEATGGEGGSSAEEEKAGEEKIAEAEQAKESEAAEAKEAEPAKEERAVFEAARPPEAKPAPRAESRRERRKSAAPARTASKPATTSAPARSTGSTSRDLLAAGKSSGIDDLFAQEKAAPARSERTNASQPYIPPPPGSGVQTPQRLGQGDIMSVVASHRQALRACARTYKEQGGGSGSVVMSWVIEPDGRTSSIKATKGAEHAGMVKCLEDQIRGWKFPSYSGPRMEPIEFPFQF